MKLMLLILIGSIGANLALGATLVGVLGELEPLKIQYKELQGDFEKATDDLANAARELEVTKNRLADALLAQGAMKREIDSLVAEQRRLSATLESYGERAMRIYE